MAEYTGAKVPLGGDKVTDFTTTKNGQPYEPNAVEVEWRKPDATVIETDTLAGGGVYRPTGSTAETDPGHFRAKRTVGGAEVLQSGYTVYVRHKETAGGAFTAWLLLETYEVVASELNIELGGTTLCSVADVKDRVANIPGLTLRAGATDARILDIVTIAHNSILARFGVSELGYLSEQQKVVGKGACILLSVADLLVSFYPQNEATARIASEYRKRAWEDVDNTTNPPQSAGKGRRLSFGVT